MTDEKNFDISPIETRFDGRLFRSRTEARWAVLFKALGWLYEYEKEGFDLDGRWYLPDFYLPMMHLWLEVKGAAPSKEEISLCHRLAAARGETVLLAIGQPQAAAEQLLAFWGDRVPDDERWSLLADRRNDREYWICRPSADGDYFEETFRIGPSAGPGHEREPVMLPGLRAAYNAALSERFAT